VRLSRNPLRILDSKDKRTQEIAQNAPSILDYLGSYSQRHFEQVQNLLIDLGINYKLNPRLVRGWTTIHTLLKFSPMIWERRQRFAVAVAMIDL